MFFEDTEEGNVCKAEVRKPITGTEIDMTYQLSGMDQPWFVDPEYAKDMGFRDRGSSRGLCDGMAVWDYGQTRVPL